MQQRAFRYQSHRHKIRGTALWLRLVPSLFAWWNVEGTGRDGMVSDDEQRFPCIGETWDIILKIEW
jgi:hypothetical protein